MSDDLISRKAAYKAFSDYLNRNFIGEIYSQTELSIGEIASVIKSIPTAFDKEMVIKELEYDKEMSKKHSTGLREQGHVEAFDEAISVVKKGGINNILL